MHLDSRWKWPSGKMQNASIFLVSNFGNIDLLSVGGQLAKVMNLAATGRIESSAIKHNSRSAIAFEDFDHTSVEVVEKRVVIVKAISHWELSVVNTWNLAISQESF